jgi:uncharacterized protein (TIGR02588 family)
MPQWNRRDQGYRQPAVEWIATGLGFVLTLGMLGFIGWQALRMLKQTAPQIDVRVASVTRSGADHVVEIHVANSSPKSAAGVEVEGTLSRTGKPDERSSATFAYVPGGSEVRSGLFFSTDPGAGDLQVRPLGYQEP